MDRGSATCRGDHCPGCHRKPSSEPQPAIFHSPDVRVVADWESPTMESPASEQSWGRQLASRNPVRRYPCAPLTAVGQLIGSWDGNRGGNGRNKLKQTYGN